MATERDYSAEWKQRRTQPLSDIEDFVRDLLAELEVKTERIAELEDELEQIDEDEDADDNDS